MERELHNMGDIGETRVVYYPGADIMTATRRSIKTVRGFNPDLIIMHVGICDITSKDRRTGKVSLKDTDSTSTIDHVLIAIDTAYRLIRNEGTPTVSISTIVGVNLNDINCKQRRLLVESEYRIHKAKKRPHEHQNLLDELILSINRLITAFNERNSTPTTWLAEAVHRYIRGRNRHYYNRLVDGCHPTTETRRRWGLQMSRTIKRVQEQTAKVK